MSQNKCSRHIPIWIFILSRLKDRTYLSRFCKNHRLNYHNGTLKEFESLGWVEIVKKGRINLIYLTVKGKELQRACQLIDSESTGLKYKEYGGGEQ